MVQGLGFRASCGFGLEVGYFRLMALGIQDGFPVHTHTHKVCL